MVSLKKRNQGFTIIELLIVILVIGILALLVITTYSGIKAKNRNATRQTDIQLIRSGLEAFFSQNGYYPSLSDMNNANWRDNNMKTLSSNDLVDPSSTCNPTSDHCLVAAPVAKAYAYAVTDSSGSSCETADTSCAKYTLTATYEGSVNGVSTDTVNNL